MYFSNLKFKNVLFQSAIVLLVTLTACGGNESNTSGNATATASGDANTLLGAGSTFIYPLFSKLFSEYNKSTGLKVNYQSIGSGGGILQLTNKTVYFGAPHAP